MKSFRQLLESMIPDQMELFEMTAVPARLTGLQHHVWMSAKGNAKHGPRIKVSNTVGKFDADDNFSLSVEDNPQHRAGTIKLKTEELESVKDWVRLNKDHLIACWNSDTMDSSDHMDGIIKI